MEHYNMSFTEEQERQMRELCSRLKTAYFSDMIAKALATIDVLDLYQSEGSTLIIRHKDGAEEPLKV